MKKITVVGALILVTAYYYWNQRYVQFFPVVEFDGDGYVTASSSPDADFYNNLAFVLSYLHSLFLSLHKSLQVENISVPASILSSDCYEYAGRN